MKLVVQVPCLNEEATLPQVLGTIPRQIDGIDEIEVVVIDDGSSDRTVEVAFEHGADHVVHHVRNMGLARSFRDGIDHALARGADIVVNTDGDNQYPQDRIPDLVRPIIEGTADIVIGDRQTATIAHFSGFKKLMQRVGSRVVNRAARTDLPDAASGFRAYSRAALMRLNIVTQFSYCMETIIQAGNRRMRIASIEIETNPKTRESRLFKNIWHHMFKSGIAIVRSYLMFRPYVLLFTLGTIFGLLGLIPFVRFGLLFFLEESGGHVQSLIFGSSMLVASFVCLALLVLADLQRTNRILLEETLERQKHLQYDQVGRPFDPAMKVPAADRAIARDEADLPPVRERVGPTG
ncbi:glycosyltransferase family 2 protein [Salsipaludibacter albus]|uniref:glycosyltransferase family 2 protein n=1 Tax=Salsipaludibacter albus TaxID=2849650 RepID=UPI001EE4C956|nr:glycosyltransferase family 2 protein [Salsipaludibacter albus]MBY5161212.1 glycosyltransferase family 2 protein [Salsipaludibacter albus]